MPTTHDEKTTTDFLAAAEPFIRSACRRLVPRRDREDVAQDTRLHVLARVLPRFDRDRRDGRFVSFLFTAVNNFVLDRARQIGRQDHPESIDDHDRFAPDTSADRLVEELAAVIVAKPETHFSDYKARLIRAASSNTDASGAELAEMLDITTGTLWPSLSRLKNEICEMARTRIA